jgi:hypothetical protein
MNDAFGAVGRTERIDGRYCRRATARSASTDIIERYSDRFRRLIAKGDFDE